MTNLKELLSSMPTRINSNPTLVELALKELFRNLDNKMNTDSALDIYERTVYGKVVSR